MRTAREEAMASIKELQDKFKAIPEDKRAGDQVNAMFVQLTDAVAKLAANPNPDALPTRRAALGSDKHYRNMERIAELPRNVQEGLDGCYIMSKLLRKPVTELRHWGKLVGGSSELKKAMDVATSTEGGTWVPTGLSSALIEDVTLMGMFEQMHPHITMPTNPFELPLQIGRLTSYVAAEQTADTGQTAITVSDAANTTGKLTLTAVPLAVRVLTSKDLEEDSIVAILPFLRKEIIAALARGIEECTINGDTTATHRDSDIEALGATDRRVAWDGYRDLSIANSYTVDFQAGGNAFDFETFLKVRAKLGKYGMNPKDLAWVTSLKTYFKMLSLKDSGNNPVVTSIDRVPQSTATTGTLGFLAGSEVKPSEFVRENLDSSGNYGAAETLTALHCVNKSGFVFGDRRDATIQLLSELYAIYRQDALIVSLRKTFAPLRPIASNVVVASGINVNIA